MQEISVYDDWRLLLVSFSEHFSVQDLMAAALSARKPDVRRQHLCVLIDLRRVDVSGLTGADSRKFANFCKATIADAPSEPAAFLIASKDQFPYIRMHNQWVDALGLRKESDTLITTDLSEALLWLEQKTNQAGLANEMLSRLTC